MMGYPLILAMLTMVAPLAIVSSADAAPCKPPESQAMLTGPLYAAIQAECKWVDAINRRDPKAAARVLDPAFRQVDEKGAVRNKTAVLSDVASGRYGNVAMNVNDVTVPFSAGSTNVVITAWVLHNRRYRVTDVYFCNIFQRCLYRLISEQITAVAR